MQAKLYVAPGSHPSHAARLMLEHKDIGYKRIDLVLIVSKLVLRAAGFPGTTVPALNLDGRRVQGSREIARVLEEVAPDPPLFPADPELRGRVEEAEAWGDETLQPIARRIIWNLLDRDRSAGRSYLEGARLGFPVGLAARTAAPIIALSKRFNRAGDEAVRADLAALPAAIEKVDAWIAEGVLDGEQLNAADFQIGTSLRLLMTMDDARPALRGHPAAELAMRVLPHMPGYAPSVLPAAWTEPLRSA